MERNVLCMIYSLLNILGYMEAFMKTSNKLIIVTGLQLISSLPVFAKTVTREIDVKIGSQIKKI